MKKTHVYFGDALDGRHDFMCVAANMKEAAAKFGVSVYYLRQNGGRLDIDNGGGWYRQWEEVAKSAPDRVWKKLISHTQPTPWVFA